MEDLEHLDIELDKLNPESLVPDEMREALIRRLKEMASRRSPDVSLNDFCASSGFDPSTVFQEFRRWSELREAAGLPRVPRRRGWGGYSVDQILDAFRRVVAEEGEQVTLAEFSRITLISPSTVSKYFSGFTELRRQAGLAPNPRGRNQFSDEQLLEYFHAVAEEVGRIPTGDEFNRLAPISFSTLSRRLGNKREIERRYVEYSNCKREAARDVFPDGNREISS